MYVPKPPQPRVDGPGSAGGAVPVITVHALKENKRPIGFAEWPPEPKAKRKPRATTRRKAP